MAYSKQTDHLSRYTPSTRARGARRRELAVEVSGRVRRQPAAQVRYRYAGVTHISMAYMVMAYIAMACIALAYTVMAYVVGSPDQWGGAAEDRSRGRSRGGSTHPSTGNTGGARRVRLARHE